MLISASTISFGYNNGSMLPEYIQPWLNYNTNIPPMHDFIPMHPHIVRNPHPAPPQPSLLSHLQSLQISPPSVTLGGFPMGGFPDPARMLFMPPANFPPFLPPIQHQVSQNVLPNLNYNGLQMNVQPHETNFTLPGNTTSHNKSFQDNIYQNQSENNSALLSEQQSKANANLELANRLNARRNIFPNDVPLVDSSPRTSCSPGINEFPRLQ